LARNLQEITRQQKAPDKMTEPLSPEELFSISDEQADELLAMIRELDLPRPAIFYTTFIHPDAQKETPTK
jgi:hypothetical protein